MPCRLIGALIAAVLPLTLVSDVWAQPGQPTRVLPVPEARMAACAFAGYWSIADDAERGILELTVEGQQISGEETWIAASGWGLGSGRTTYDLRVVGPGRAEGNEVIYNDETPITSSGTTSLFLIDGSTLRKESTHSAFVETFFVKILPKRCRA